MSYWDSDLGPTRRFSLAALIVASGLGAAGIGLAQQQPEIGIAPITVSDRPHTFDTAEQHNIRAVVVARGLAHPFSLAFLPNGDALVTERGARLRIVRGATGRGQSPVLDPEPVDGVLLRIEPTP